ncbi:double-stranded DNA-binding domain-containing protein [Exophiala viscosa]|uniref:double-stranded DNA-binding domain-containing protein n=1 Tax=Exophiala viscosa TaxID=2486360 RepID=UPI002194B880|nr:double-stranded DNA-binding domain-containing protein [Exophiala viscosa]
MADDDLAQIRAARLAQLKQQQGGAGAGDAGGDDEGQRRKQESEARSSMLNQILEPEAADRLGRIRMVKESRATDVENRLIMLARSGQLRQKVTEDQLKDMLASLSEHEKQTGHSVESVKVVRRGGWDDDDLDDLLNES